MRTPRARTWILCFVVVAAGVAGWFALRRAADDPDAPPPPPSNVGVASDNFALLVGCTEYPELKKLDPASYESTVRLLGPGNDVHLMRDTLVRYLGVPERNIRVLTGWPDDPAARPTRDNILGQLDRLAREIPRGARVLFLFAGHGSLQPAAAGGNEADQVTEILLPADAGKWDPATRGASRAITDDEIRARFLALRDAGAQVWGLFDCCHSGTMMRGTASDDAAKRPDVGAVRSRGLTPDQLGIPHSVTSSPVGAVAGAPARVRGVFDDRRRPTEAGIVAISAAHSSESAPEMVLPSNPSARDRAPHGLCTFQVVRALQRFGGGLSVSEIFEHVRAAYASMPWDEATPLIDGDLGVRVTTSEAASTSLLTLRRDAGRLLLDAGYLRGLTVGTVLEVRRVGPSGDATPALGRVRLTEVEPLYSVCGAVPGGPDLAGIPEGARCRIVENGAGGPPLKLALVYATDAPMPRALVRGGSAAAAIDADQRAQFAFVEPWEADWHLRELPAGGDGLVRFRIEPAAAGTGIEPFEVASGELTSALRRVRRADSLRGWASAGSSLRIPEGVAVEASFRRLGSDRLEPIVAGTALLPGDFIALRVTNASDKDVDVAVKCLDASQAESQVWPLGKPSHPLTREESREPVAVDEQQVSDDGIGRESFVVIVAVRSPQAGPLQLGDLSGSASLPAAEDLARRRGEHALVESVTGGKARGIGDKPVAAVGVHEIAWTTTWGKMGVPTVLFDGMVELNPPVTIGAPGQGGTSVPGRRATWRKARILPGDEGTADVLLLSGDGEAAGVGALGILVDENGDAGLATADPVAAARLAAAGKLPVEVMVVLEGSTSSASYPSHAGDGVLGHVRVGSDRPDRDRASRRFDLDAGGWTSRETCGPWLSSRFVPFEDGADETHRLRVVQALRRFCRPFPR